MKLGKIRVTDTSTACGATCPLPASTLDFASSPFAGRDFANEVASIDGNHFDEFDLTGVGFGTLPGYIDAAESTVELWLYDGTPSGTTRVFTLQQAISEAEAFVDALPNAIGIAVTYSGTDPGLNGNRILVGDDLVMHLDVRLRATERLSGRPVQGGESGSAVNVPNTALARGWDAVVDPSTQPTDTDGANIELTQARVRVGLEKSISVDHGDSSDRTILETDPQAPVNVRLTADPDGSTAPLDTLRIEDRTASFWDRFAFVSFGTPTHPTDADSARLEVIVDGDWEVFADYTGDLDEIRGVRATFSRTTGNGLFPQGATSWNASWGTATLPFTVVLRDDAAVDWSDDQEENLATAFAENEEYGEAEAEDDDRVVFSPGTNAIEVIKRAPNDTGDHRIDPLVSLPWRLVFTNTGTGYLPVTKVTDALPAALDWDGEQPTVNVTPGDSGSGLGEDPSIELSADGRNLVFAWPAGQRMHPGERVEVELGLILQPVGAGQRATNGLIVETGVPLDTCTQPRTHGQDPQAPTAENLCTNNNFVEPEAGTVIGARKTVNGEPAETLGEHLVSGALDVRTDEECAAGNFLPIGSDYTRNPCASYTAVGATDTWKLENMNVGTNALSRMTIVDMLPNPGDKMLAGGAARTSTFRPVLVDPSAIRLTGLPDGAVYTVEVTTNPAACVGAGSGSLWLADPECSDTTANPANIWTLLDDYTGEIRDIVGLRFKVDMTANALPPAGSVVVEFETVNRVIDQSDAGLQPTLEQFAERQFAWNQNGLIAWDTAGNRVNLPKAPSARASPSRPARWS
ncbi:hypothetical protein [Leucobacter soli]|uniref:hypothetical protein n=1 Tax=Leucobacter soli TaxID=2812850 RepID=UPI003607F6C2